MLANLAIAIKTDRNNIKLNITIKTQCFFSYQCNSSLKIRALIIVIFCSTQEGRKMIDVDLSFL